MDVWDLSQAAAARRFHVSRQAFAKWLRQGAPAERATAVADLAAATDLLVRHLKRDRIPAVVRRPDPGAWRGFLDGPAGAWRYARAARGLPGDVPVRARPGLTVELLYETVPDGHVWWRIADQAWVDPLDPGFAREVGGRWNPPDSFPTLYLNEDMVTARLNLRAFIAGWPYGPEDLREDTGPVLVGCTLPRRQVVCDVHTPAGVHAAGMPATYPLDEDGTLVPHNRCQPVGAHAQGPWVCAESGPDRRRPATAQGASWRGFPPRPAASPDGSGCCLSRHGSGDSREASW